MVSISSIGRVAKAAGRLIFMDPEFTQLAEKELASGIKKYGYKNAHKAIWNGFKQAETATQNKAFWGGIKKLVTDLPTDLKNGWAAKGALGKLKGIGGTVVKRLPLLFVAMELPNIFSAFKDEGLIGGIKEIGKSGARMAGSMAGFMIGQSLIPIPIIGGLVGAFASDWLISKVVGKSHTEKKEEMQEALSQADMSEQQAQLLQQQLMQEQMLANQTGNNMYTTNPQAQNTFSVPQATMTPQQIMAMGQMLQGGYGLPNGNYMDQDFMAMTSGLKRMNYLC